jgi:hypothetical protein
MIIMAFYIRTGTRPIMTGIFQLDESITDADLQRLTSAVLFYLVEKCGGEVSVSPCDAARLLFTMQERMMYMKLERGMTLRIVARPPELSGTPENAVAL